MHRLIIGIFMLAGIAPETPTLATGNESMESTAFNVIEFRRYTIKDGGRDAFAAYKVSRP